MRILSISLLVIIIASAGLLAVLASSYPELGSLVLPASQLVDACLPIARFASRASDPDVAFTYYSVAIFAIPATSIAVIAALLSPSANSFPVITSLGQLIKRFIAGCLLTTIGVLGFLSYAGQSARGLPVGDSEFGLVLLGWVPMAGIGAMVGAGVVFLWFSLFPPDS